jgi:uncharacterized protein YodC (DUF2158 family)
MAKFNPGDSVRLKSGGPVLTVDWWSENTDQYICSWFVEKKYETGYFSEASLEVAIGDKPNVDALKTLEQQLRKEIRNIEAKLDARIEALERHLVDIRPARLG